VKKKLVMALALVLIVVATVGLTLAWLTDTTDPVKNTFTTSDIDITLEESVDLDLKMVPGLDITKDPKVTVLAGSEECYLFVKLDKSDNFDTFMTYEVDTTSENWTKLTGAGITDEIYYRKVLAAGIGTEYSVLKGDKVTVKGEEVTKEMMKALTPVTYPTLTVTAYASQLYKSATEQFTPIQAWGNVDQPSTP
jgi:hypothetical protein